MKKVILLSGWRQSGKDTAAGFMKEFGVKRLAFADKLKDMVAEQYGIPRDHCDNPEFKESPVLSMPVSSKDKFCDNIHGVLGQELKSGYWTPRALCMLEGGIKRAADPDYWVKAVINEIRGSTDKFFVVTDWRYKSEYNKLRAALGDCELVTVRVNRFNSIQSNDVSEHDLDDFIFDLNLHNKGSLKTYKLYVEHLMEVLEIGKYA